MSPGEGRRQEKGERKDFIFLSLVCEMPNPDKLGQQVKIIYQFHLRLLMTLRRLVLSVDRLLSLHCLSLSLSLEITFVPFDSKILAKACLIVVEYLLCRADYSERCQD